MSCCDSKSVDRFICMSCGERCDSVDQATVHSLLKDEFRPLLKNSAYYYCSNKACGTVYCSAEGTFSTSALRVAVFHKDQGLDVPICYCFKITRREILNDMRSDGRTSALNDIKAKMKRPGCFCQQSNPQGKCCLPNVEEYIKELLLKN